MLITILALRLQVKLFARKVIKLTKSDFLSKIATPPLKFFFLKGAICFFFGFSFAWLIGPGIFRGNFKGRYAGRINRQNWKSLNFSPVVKKYPFPHPRVVSTTCKKNLLKGGV